MAKKSGKTKGKGAAHTRGATGPALPRGPAADPEPMELDPGQGSGVEQAKRQPGAEKSEHSQLLALMAGMQSQLEELASNNREVKEQLATLKAAGKETVVPLPPPRHDEARIQGDCSRSETKPQLKAGA